MKTYIGVMLAAALVLPAAAGAQEKKPFVEARGSVKPVPLPPGGPAPRMSDGHVDLSGNWFPGPTGQGQRVERRSRSARAGRPGAVSALGRGEVQGHEPGGPAS